MQNITISLVTHFKNHLSKLLLGTFLVLGTLFPNALSAQITYCTNCSGTTGACANPTTNPNNNPDLMAACGELDIVFVVDESNSINTAAEQAAVRQGTLSFLNSLSCTGSRVAMVEFATTARIVNNYREVDNDYVSDVTDYFDGTNNSGVNNENFRDVSGNSGGTNWQAAMLAVDEFTTPDIILFFTDGVPTAYSTGQNPTKNSATTFCGSGNSTQRPEIANPVKLANKLKAEGAHMFMLGVGNTPADVNVPTLQQMSGNDELIPNTGDTLGTSDYIVEDFSGLAQCLVDLVSDICPFDSDVDSNNVCSGELGSATITVNSPQFPTFDYTYFNDDTNAILGSGTNETSPFVINNIAVGSYRIEVMVEVPGENCTRTETFFFDVEAFPAPDLSGSIMNVDCFGGATGEIDVSVSNGTSPFTYAWNTSNGSGLVAGVQDQTNLTAGDYTVVVTDDNGCTDEETFTITEPDAELSTSITGTDVLCFGESTGEADLSVSGGTPPYMYSWNNGATSQDLANLAAGTYDVTVTDDNGCEAMDSITITQPDATLSTAIVGTDVGCVGESTGEANLTVNGGTPPYMYSWNNGATSQDLANLAAGTYDVTVTDDNGCEIMDSITISEPDEELSCSVTLDSGVTVNGASDGAATANPGGGTAPYSYAWDNGEVTQQATGLDAGLHTVTITDANNCETTCEVTVPQPDELTCTISLVSNISCNGLSDGSATTNPVGGVAPFSYAWSNGEITQTAVALAAGLHNVMVTDANGAQTSCEITITEPNELTSSITGTNVLCFGEATGEADLTVEGGTPPYMYSWNNGATTQDLAVLTAGTFTVTITDANGCQTMDSVTITQPDEALSTSIVGTDVGCFGESTGEADLTVNGGTPPYMYSWNNGATTQDLANLEAGTYDVTITDDNGCVIMDSVTILQPDMVLMCSIMLDSGVTINGASDGAATSNPTGGTAPYSYEWDNGEMTQQATALSAGLHSVIIRDANGCETSCEVTVPEPDQLICNVSLVNNVLCFGESTGSATANPMGGVAPYGYDWSNGESTQTAIALDAGLHTVTITDANGAQTMCEITITEPMELTSSITGTNVLCFGEATGEADLMVNGGTPPYMYSWNNGATSQDLAVLAAGTYDVTITDANGCQTMDSVTITEPDAALSTGIQSTDVGCFGESTGTADLTVEGGTPPYMYSWSNGATTQDLANLAAGTYDVTVTDANGCQIMDSIDIAQPDQELTCSVTLDSGVTVNGASDGVATANPNGGTGPYSYAWDNGEMTQQATGLDAGLHTVTITDANNCETTCEVTVPQPDQLACTISPLNNVSCFDGADGSATANPVGGVGPFTYSWSNGEVTQTAVALAAGLNTVMITDANGAQTSCEITITQPDELTCSITLNSGVSVNGASDGVATANPVGGTAPYSYAWDNGEVTQQAVALNAGLHTVMITDANGCETSCEVEVPEPDVLSCTISFENDVSCPGLSDGSATVNPVGGVGPYTYDWSNGETTQTAVALIAGIYTVFVTDANGAVTRCDIEIKEPEPPNAGDDNEVTVCDGTVVDLTNLVSEPGGSFSEDMPSGGLNGSSFDTSGLSPGSYVIIYSVGIPQTACPPDTAEITINVATKADAGDDNEVTVCDGEVVDLSLLVSIGGGTFTDPGLSGGLSGSDFDTTGLSPGSYDLIYTVGSGNENCPDDTATITVNVDEPLDAGGDENIEVCEGTIIDLNALVSVSGGTFSDPGMTGGLNGDEFDTTGLTPGTYEIIYTVSGNNSCPGDTATIIIEVVEDLIAKECKVIDADFCSPNEDPFYNFYWNAMQDGPNASPFFAQDGSHTMSYTEFNDGTALIQGFTQQGSCSAEVYVVLKERKDWTQWSADGGGFKAQGCAGAVPEDLFYYVVDDTQSFIKVTGGDCIDQGTFRVFQRPDPNDPNTPNYGFHVGPGAALWDSNGLSEGLAGWAWMSKDGVAKRYIIDFNFRIDCDEKTGCEPEEEDDLECQINLNEGVSCAGDESASATVIPEGGAPPYTYLWSDGQTTPQAVNLGEGVYSVTVTDSKGQTSSCDVIVEELQPLTCSTMLLKMVTGSDATNGSAKVTAEGGTAPYTYLWDNGENTMTATALSLGMHSVKVTDKNGCETVCYIDIPQAPSFACEVEKEEDVSCYDGSDGSATALPIGGLAPYSYLWDNQETTATAVGLTAGVHSVIITDANGRETSCEITIGSPPELTCVAMVFSDVTTNGGMDGQATVTPSGGTPPYSYEWDNGETNAMAISLTAGLHEVTVTDANGCETTCEVTLTEPAPLSCEIINPTEVSCKDGNDGMAEVNVDGGAPPYTYAWSNGETTQKALALSAGMHSVTVTDNSGAQTTCEILIEEVDELTAETKLEASVSIFGENDGSATVTAEGGTPPYSYLWDNGEITATATMLTAGVHTVKVTDSKGCETVAEIEIPGPDELSCQIDLVQDVNCFDGEDGSATVIPQGGVGPYSYLWDNGETNATAVMLTAGLHSVMVMDSNGAQTSCDIEIGQPDDELICNIVDKTDSNEGENNGSATVLAEFGTSPYTYLWDDPQAQTAETATDLAPGIYDVLVTDANGCTRTCSVLIEEIPEEPPTGCETAYARDENSNRCFTEDGFGNWGWTNSYSSEGTYTLDLYSGAGQCNLNAGTKSGEVTLEISNGRARVSVQMEPGFVMTEAQYYIGEAMYPVNNGNQPTVAPGQYPYKAENLNNITQITFDPVDVGSFNNGFYFIFHAVTCIDQNQQTSNIPTVTRLNTFHKSFSNTLNVELELPYDGEIGVQFMDMSGKVVKQTTNRQLKAGKHILEYRIHALSAEVHILRVSTGKEVLAKKVFFLK